MLNTLEQIRTALSSAYPITLLVSPEEDRQERLLRRFASAAKPEPLPVIVWNCVDGFLDNGSDVYRDPMKALEWIAADGPKGLYLLKDFESVNQDKHLRRALRDTAMKIRNTDRFLFMLQQDAALPESIKPLTYVVISMFPDEGELKTLVSSLLDGKTADKPDIDRLVGSLKGMSLTEVEHLLRRLLDRHEALDEDFFSAVLEEKEQITRKEGILEFVPPDASLAKLGGLDQLKEWVGERGSLFDPDSRRQNLPRPRGVLLMGISGCGKSLAVKIIAREWKLPLFRLDMNLVFAGVQGSAEWIFHRALEAVESVAPAVLWIDEIEMGIAGYHEGETGSNTRIFSTFLTWMQEHRSDVFVAATANRINLLPAEILRKGRFDQVFFVDLPNDEERKEILSIHLARNGLDPATYDLILLASATRTWNGAEIEQAVKSAVITAHARGSEVTQNDLLAAFGKIIPLSRTMEEQLKAIRSWARNRALPATKVEKPAM
ncbi:MAG: AAA family ATPase [Acidobacteria bacterium]|jgi:SpoVK/Ycf46/Vps4 family AAA+-type ATPase|nr:AAA family ATPase [Acidobacteriota bacterium]